MNTYWTKTEFLFGGHEASRVQLFEFFPCNVVPLPETRCRLTVTQNAPQDLWSSLCLNWTLSQWEKPTDSAKMGKKKVPSLYRCSSLAMWDKLYSNDRTKQCDNEIKMTEPKIPKHTNWTFQAAEKPGDCAEGGGGVTTAHNDKSLRI